jgi:acid phosphatase family membrane protein YuiD
MVQFDTRLPAALERRDMPSCHSASVKRLAAEMALRYVDVPHSVDAVHAGHGART